MIAFACPLCRQPLARGLPSWSCAAGHAFDVAREGYVNLLPVQHKASRDPGDAADMVTARREFLEAGFYQPLRAAVVAALAGVTAGSVIDLGCGEGYYTSALAEAAPEVLGVDISRAAIRAAARRYRNLTWVVASGARLPLPDGAVRAAASVFCRLHPAETRRVLAPGGHLVVAGPAADHLRGLREALFEEVRAHEPDKTTATLAGDFEPVRRIEVRFPLQLDRADLSRLLCMTPYAWRAERGRREALAASPAFSTEAAFVVDVFRRKA